MGLRSLLIKIYAIGCSLACYLLVLWTLYMSIYTNGVVTIFTNRFGELGIEILLATLGFPAFLWLLWQGVKAK